MTLDGVWDEFLEQGQWRLLLTSPLVMPYILAVSRWLAASHAKMLAAFRPVVQVDDQAFERMVRSATHINPTGEIIALSVGVLAGLDNLQPPLTQISYFECDICRLHCGQYFAIIMLSITGTITGTITRRRGQCFPRLDERP